jgi:hypothetical protein
VLLSDGLQRIPADPHSASGQNQTHDEGRDRFHAAMAVRMIRVRGLHGDDQSQQDDGRREHVTGELHAGRDNRRGLRDDSDEDVGCGKKRAASHTGQSDASGCLSILFELRVHQSIIDRDERYATGETRREPRGPIASCLPLRDSSSERA